MRMGGVLSDRTVGCSGAACALTGVGATIAAGACGCGGGTCCCCCCWGTSKGCISTGISGIVEGGLEGESRGGGEPASGRDEAVSRCDDARVRPAISLSPEVYPPRSGADARGRSAGDGSPPASDFSAFALPSSRNLTSFSISFMMVLTSL